MNEPGEKIYDPVTGIELPPLPTNSEQVAKIASVLDRNLFSKIDIQESMWRAAPELRKSIPPRVKGLLKQGIAECFVMLGMDESHVPDFIIVPKNARDLIFASDNPPAMQIMPGEKDDHTWAIDWEKLLAIAYKIEDDWESAESAMKNGKWGPSLFNANFHDLHRLMGHEAFHIFDLYFNKERAQKAAEVNRKTHLTNLAEGEVEPEAFGRHFAELKLEQFKANF